MRLLQTVTIMLFVELSMPYAIASGFNYNVLDIDFTNNTDAQAKAIWSTPDKLNVTKEGFGWDGNATSSLSVSIRTVPFAIGFSWYPPVVSTITVRIQPESYEHEVNGKKHTSYPGNLYVRYSPDLLHWSTWQALQCKQQIIDGVKKSDGRNFTGYISIPLCERKQYQELLFEYEKLDVPWKSDEDAAVRWIVENDPDFFSKQLPFIGYVEFLYENDLSGGERITKFEAELCYSTGGPMHFPEDGKKIPEYRGPESETWSFKAKEIEGNKQPASLIIKEIIK